VFSVGQNQRYNEKEIDERLRDHALFVAFAPADDPQIALAIVVENGRSGSGTAAPIARKVFDAFLLPPELARNHPPDHPPSRRRRPRGRGMRAEIAGPGYSSRAKRTFTVSGRVLEALHSTARCCSRAGGVRGRLVVLFSAAGEDLGVFVRQARALASVSA